MQWYVISNRLFAFLWWLVMLKPLSSLWHCPKPSHFAMVHIGETAVFPNSNLCIEECFQNQVFLGDFSILILDINFFLSEIVKTIPSKNIFAVCGFCYCICIIPSGKLNREWYYECIRGANFKQAHTVKLTDNGSRMWSWSKFRKAFHWNINKELQKNVFLEQISKNLSL